MAVVVDGGIVCVVVSGLLWLLGMVMVFVVLFVVVVVFLVLLSLFAVLAYGRDVVVLLLVTLSIVLSC